MDAKGIFQKAQDQRSKEALDEAISTYQKAHGQALKEKNLKLAAESSHMIGVIYSQQEKWDLAEKFLNTSLKEFEGQGESDLVGAVLRDLGLLYYDQKDYQKAKQFMEESIGKLVGSKKLGHLGISQVKLGLIEAKMGKPEDGEVTIQMGIENIEGSPEKFFLSIAYYNLAQVQKDLGKIKEAKVAAGRSLDILNQIAEPDEFLGRRQKIDKFLKELGI